MNHQYERPVVTDYGSVVDLTRATGFIAEEDGGSKLLIHHLVSNPTIP